MPYMLDTSVCVFAIRQRSEALLRRLKQSEPGQVVLSVVTLAELEYGVSRSQAPDRAARALESFLCPFEVVSFSALAAVVYGRVRERLESSGLPIGPLDTLIAAHALARDATLVTNNVREFERVPGLVVEDWTMDA